MASLAPVRASAAADSPVLNEKAQRLAIAFHFVHALDMPAEGEWKELGTVKAIMDHVFTHLNARQRESKRKVIMNVLEDVLWCDMHRCVYTGDRAPRDPDAFMTKIALDSPEAQIIADAIEDGFSMTMARDTVNDYRIGLGKEELTRSAVYSCYKRKQASRAVEGSITVRELS